MKITQDDLLSLEVDAIVNPANCFMDTPGELDLKIHNQAGPQLMEYLERFKKREFPNHRPVCLPAGTSVIAPGFNLKSRFCVMTCGPIWEEYVGRRMEAREALANSYRSAMQVAFDAGCKSIAFPCISCGVFHFPIAIAARIAIKEMLAFENAHQGFQCVAVCYGAYERTIYDETFAKISKSKSRRS